MESALKTFLTRPFKVKVKYKVAVKKACSLSAMSLKSMNIKLL